MMMATTPSTATTAVTATRTTAAAHAVRDSMTMFRRQLRRARRYPELTLMIIGIPVIFLLLFVYVFGGTLGAGLGAGAAATGAGSGAGSGAVSGADGRAEYVNYVVPGILLMAVAMIAQGTAVSVAMDMTQGIINRFRTMSIAPGAVITGHVLGAVLQSLVAVVTVVAVAFAVGFRPQAGVLDWFAALALVIALSLGMSWLSVACGLVSRSVESASNLPMPLILLPFLGSGFVPTDSMPTALRWFAQYQPFTPVMDTLRGLLLAEPVTAATVWLAVSWCLLMVVGGWVWARRAYARPSRR